MTPAKCVHHFTIYERVFPPSNPKTTNPYRGGVFTLSRARQRCHTLHPKKKTEQCFQIQKPRSLWRNKTSSMQNLSQCRRLSLKGPNFYFKYTRQKKNTHRKKTTHKKRENEKEKKRKKRAKVNASENALQYRVPVHACINQSYNSTQTQKKKK